MGSFGFKRRHGLSFYGMGHASNTGNKSSGGFFDFLVLHKSEILMFLPFFVMDLSLRIMGHKIEFYPAYYLQPNLFTIIWVGLFIAVTKYLKGIFGKIFYWLIFIISFIMFLTNAIYYPLTSFYFNFYIK